MSPTPSQRVCEWWGDCRERERGRDLGGDLSLTKSRGGVVSVGVGREKEKWAAKLEIKALPRG